MMKKKKRFKGPPPKSKEHLDMEIKMMLFFGDLIQKYPERNPEKLAAWGLYAYADAVINQKSAMDIFSCDDKILLVYRKEMQEEFGLEILTPEEAKEREKREAFTRRTVDVTEDMKRVTDFVKKKRNYEKKYKNN